MCFLEPPIIWWLGDFVSKAWLLWFFKEFKKEGTLILEFYGVFSSVLPEILSISPEYFLFYLNYFVLGDNLLESASFCSKCSFDSPFLLNYFDYLCLKKKAVWLGRSDPFNVFGCATFTEILGLLSSRNFSSWLFILWIERPDLCSSLEPMSEIWPKTFFWFSGLICVLLLKKGKFSQEKTFYWLW